MTNILIFLNKQNSHSLVFLISSLNKLVVCHYQIGLAHRPIGLWFYHFIVITILKCNYEGDLVPYLLQYFVRDKCEFDITVTEVSKKDKIRHSFCPLRRNLILIQNMKNSLLLNPRQGFILQFNPSEKKFWQPLL